MFFVIFFDQGSRNVLAFVGPFDDWLFLIADSPQVSLRLGRTLDADNIRTGHDVYFECDVKANPKPLRLEWLHNVSKSIDLHSITLNLGNDWKAAWLSHTEYSSLRLFLYDF